MSVKRPNQFRWQIEGAAGQLIVANGNTLWIYDKDLNQATRQNVNTQVGDTPALLLSGDPSKIATNFTVTQPISAKITMCFTQKIAMPVLRVWASPLIVAILL